MPIITYNYVNFYYVKCMMSYNFIFGSQNKSQNRATLNLKLSNELSFEAKSGPEIISEKCTSIGAKLFFK